MKKTSGFFLTLTLAMIVSLPILAADDSASGAPTSTTKVTTTSKKAAKAAAATASTTPAPAAPASAPAPTSSSASNNPLDKPTETVKVGNLEIGHAKISSSGGNYDVFMSIKNNGKGDEKISGAGTTWENSNVVQVTKDKDGKEVESPVAIAVPADKTTDLEKGGVWIRVKDAKQPKGAPVFPISLYFRSSPNANVRIATSGESSGISSWFSR